MILFSRNSLIQIVTFQIGLLFFGCISGRSVHRPPDPNMAELRTRWVDKGGDNALKSQEYSLRSYEFEPSAIFEVFDRDYCMRHVLPEGPINFRYNPEKTVGGRTLGALLETFIEDLKKTKQVKKEYERIKILKKSNFNPKLMIGSLIIKFKEYPFVAKLFFETPRTFVRPGLRDLEQRCLFYMGGGVSRYLSGFTRLKNREFIHDRVQEDPRWKDIIDMPRKWFWLPRNAAWFDVKGYRVGGVPERRTTLPGVYAIIADALEAERVLSSTNEHDKAVIFEFTQWLDQILDPNIANYMVEKHTGKIVFIDTEHFPTNLGLRERIAYRKNAKNLMGGLPQSMYVQLAGKYLSDAFLRSKQERLNICNGAVKSIRKPGEAIQCNDSMTHGEEGEPVPVTGGENSEVMSDR